MLLEVNYSNNRIVVKKHTLDFDPWSGYQMMSSMDQGVALWELGGGGGHWWFGRYWQITKKNPKSSQVGSTCPHPTQNSGLKTYIDFNPWSGYQMIAWMDQGVILWDLGGALVIWLGHIPLPPPPVPKAMLPVGHKHFYRYQYIMNYMSNKYLLLLHTSKQINKHHDNLSC